MKERRYYAAGATVCDQSPNQPPIVAHARSAGWAKRIVNALNSYRPKVRRQKPAEKVTGEVFGRAK